MASTSQPTPKKCEPAQATKVPAVIDSIIALSSASTDPLATRGSSGRDRGSGRGIFGWGDIAATEPAGRAVNPEAAPWRPGPASKADDALPWANGSVDVSRTTTPAKPVGRKSCGISLA